MTEKESVVAQTLSALIQQTATDHGDPVGVAVFDFDDDE